MNLMRTNFNLYETFGIRGRERERESKKERKMYSAILRYINNTAVMQDTLLGESAQTPA